MACSPVPVGRRCRRDRRFQAIRNTRIQCPFYCLSNFNTGVASLSYVKYLIYVLMLSTLVWLLFSLCLGRASRICFSSSFAFYVIWVNVIHISFVSSVCSTAQLFHVSSSSLVRPHIVAAWPYRDACSSKQISVWLRPHADRTFICTQTWKIFPRFFLSRFRSHSINAMPRAL